MPGTSTNFEFTINNQTTVQVDHPADSSAVSYTSASTKGDGYYKGGDGYHTISFKITNFTGKIKFQASLVDEPTANDWFDIELVNPNSVSGYNVDTTGVVETGVGLNELDYTSAGTTATKIYNAIGNFVWVRANINTFTQGTVNYIRMNY